MSWIYKRATDEQAALQKVQVETTIQDDTKRQPINKKKRRVFLEDIVLIMFIVIAIAALSYVLHE